MLKNNELLIINKKTITALVIFLQFFTASSQQRVNTAPESLSFKSKELKTAYFWKKESKSGKWVSRKNTVKPYSGEGIFADNFISLFTGEYKDYRYLFIDYWIGRYQYPALALEWGYYRTIMAAQISESEYNKLQNISQGEIVEIKSLYYNECYKGRSDYSFSLFLNSTETYRSLSMTMYKMNMKSLGEDHAKNVYKKEYPPISIIVAKRFVENDIDVIRFLVYPHSTIEFIDDNYFEIKYLEFNDTVHKNV